MRRDREDDAETGADALTPTPADQAPTRTKAERAEDRDKLRSKLSAVRVLQDIKTKGCYWPPSG